MHRGVRVMALLLACASVAASGGCYRYHTHVPGVIDMRTDGSEAEPARVKVRSLARNEALGVFIGRGVQRAPERRIMLEDRHYWIAGNIPIINTSARDDLEPMLKRAPGWRGLTIKDEMSIVDVLAVNIIPAFIPLTGYVLPPFTFTFAGEPIGHLEATPLPSASTPTQKARAKKAPAKQSPAKRSPANRTPAPAPSVDQELNPPPPPLNLEEDGR